MGRLKTDSFKKENSDSNKLLIEMSNGNRHKTIMAQHSIKQSRGYYCLHTSKLSCKLQILSGEHNTNSGNFANNNRNATKTSKWIELVHFIDFSQVG